MIEYVGVLLLILAGLLFTAITVFVSGLVRPGKITPEKIMPYECGENPVGQPWGVQFNIRFYVFALVFLIFDVEAVMLLPWAVVFEEIGPFAFWAGVIFISMLLLGLVDVWAKGDLEWVRGEEREAIRARGTPGKAA